MDASLTVEALRSPVSAADVDALATLLVDAVESGAAVSFVAPFPLERARAWWRHMIDDADVRAIILVARDGDGVVGTVQLHPAWAPNQPHRGDISKLIVHRRARRTGLGTRLMREIEHRARSSGYRLLTLDTKRADPAESLYTRLGWTAVGTIPRYAVDPDGVTPHDAVIFYKEL